jgi:hypothetical protein
MGKKSIIFRKGDPKYNGCIKYYFIVFQYLFLNKTFLSIAIQVCSYSIDSKSIANQQISDVHKFINSI